MNLFLAFTLAGNIVISGNVKLDNSGSAYSQLPASLSMTQPTVPIFQRQSNASGNIPVSGTALGFQDVQGSFAGGAWVTVASRVNGTFSGYLTNQLPGQGQILLRLSRQTNITASSTPTNIGLGDIFVIAGQSNATGQGSNNQTYASAVLKAWNFRNSYVWADLAESGSDYNDSPNAQVDAVSQDSPTSQGGSAWPLLATIIITNQSCPVAFIPCALSSTAIAAWEAGANHIDRTTLYGSMNWRGSVNNQPNGIRAVLWWQGEANSGDTTYLTNFTLLASNIVADLGCKIIPALLPTNSTMTYQTVANVDYINQQFRNAATSNSSVVGTPADLTQVNVSPSGVHAQSNAALQAVAVGFFAAIKTTFGW